MAGGAPPPGDSAYKFTMRTGFTAFPAVSVHGLPHYPCGGFYMGLGAESGPLDPERALLFEERGDLGEDFERYRHPLMPLDCLKLPADADAFVLGTYVVEIVGKVQLYNATVPTASTFGKTPPADVYWSVSNAPGYNTKHGEDDKASRGVTLPPHKIMPHMVDMKEPPTVVVCLATGRWGLVWEDSTAEGPGADAVFIPAEKPSRKWPHFSTLSGLFMIRPRDLMCNRAGVSLFVKPDGSPDAGAVRMLWDELGGKEAGVAAFRAAVAATGAADDGGDPAAAVPVLEPPGAKDVNLSLMVDSEDAVSDVAVVDSDPEILEPEGGDAGAGPSNGLPSAKRRRSASKRPKKQEGGRKPGAVMVKKEPVVSSKGNRGGKFKKR
ncbi:hypothetical protein HYH03_017319 [Edaphochlamys debaryana]|uniref:Uncharacterized protein n=1 Tax=Edaphochlamys debaryana TaxID=47281 RepID=A0A835XHD6_9CHLO|nr:hypothetical protein HYH03_017319 [Edaphochlamys debaryana]|eukprot:KAG2483796.1 hypothetical protein HYH03_017319 [Edaphochlamys debaryana]